MVTDIKKRYSIENISFNHDFCEECFFETCSSLDGDYKRLEEEILKYISEIKEHSYWLSWGDDLSWFWRVSSSLGLKNDYQIPYGDIFYRFKFLSDFLSFVDVCFDTEKRKNHIEFFKRSECQKDLELFKITSYRCKQDRIIFYRDYAQEIINLSNEIFKFIATFQHKFFTALRIDDFDLWFDWTVEDFLNGRVDISRDVIIDMNLILEDFLCNYEKLSKDDVLSLRIFIGMRT